MVARPSLTSLDDWGWDSIERIIIGSASALQSIYKELPEDSPYLDLIKTGSYIEASTEPVTIEKTLSNVNGMLLSDLRTAISALETDGWVNPYTKESDYTRLESLSIDYSDLAGNGYAQIAKHNETVLLGWRPVNPNFNYSDDSVLYQRTVGNVGEILFSKKVDQASAAGEFIGEFQIPLQKDTLKDGGALIDNAIALSTVALTDFVVSPPSNPSTPLVPTIPDNVDSLEKLLVWGCLVLNISLYPNPFSYITIQTDYSADIVTFSLTLPLSARTLSINGNNMVGASLRVCSSYTALDNTSGSDGGDIIPPNYQYWLDPANTVDDLKGLNVAIGANCWVKSKLALYAKIVTLPDGVTTDDDLFIASSADAYYWKKGGTGQGTGTGTPLTADEIRDLLAGLSGGDRLDATAIKNLPSAGPPGADGLPGADGADGLSAYEVAIANGFVGTESDWLTSLEGVDGLPGVAGTVSAASGLILDVTGEPLTPDTGKLIIWASALDGLLYKKDDAGIISAIGSGGLWGGREVLTSDRIYYVRTDGNDSNNGLTNTSGGAFLTIQKAIDVAATLDLSIYNVTISFFQSFNISSSIICKKGIGQGTLILDGNNTAILTATPENTITLGMIQCSTIGIQLRNFKTEHANPGVWSFHVVCRNSGYLEIDGLNFGALPSVSGFDGHLMADTNAIIKISSSDYKISGGASGANATSRHYFARDGGCIATFGAGFQTVSITNSPKFTTFAFCENGTIQDYNTTYLGQIANGCKKYNVIANGVINQFTAGGGVYVFPGSINGTSSTGGQYL